VAPPIKPSVGVLAFEDALRAAERADRAQLGEQLGELQSQSARALSICVRGHDALLT
jgi:hypothetical protein